MMNSYSSLSRILLGSFVATTAIVVQAQSAFALSGEEINDIARDVSVLIVREDGNHGSGVIISEDNGTYYVLTADHVMRASGTSRIVTSDQNTHAVVPDRITSLSGVDLAVIQFESRNRYQVAKLANSETTKQGATVYVSGWPASGESIKEVVRQFTMGNVSQKLEQEATVLGYQMVYTNITRRGMSGGPVFDTGGRVVAIHGLADAEQFSEIQQSLGVTESQATRLGVIAGKTGFNMGIPINTFLDRTSQARLYLSIKVENSAPEKPSPAQLASEPKVREDDTKINIATILGGVLPGLPKVPVPPGLPIPPIRIPFRW
jgi:serine protease Do